MRNGFAILVCKFNFLSCYSFTALIGDEEGLSLLGNCRRDISSHFKTYGLSKRSEHICYEVDLLLCGGGELNIHIFFSLLTTIESINDKRFRRASQWQGRDLTIFFRHVC